MIFIPRQIIYKGVTFANIQLALFNMYFYYDSMPEAQIDEALSHIVPMQHNIENPLQQLGAKDTFIEYWIARDTRIAQDYSEGNAAGGENAAYKMAVVDIRFIGEEAEVWAKAFHHINQRENVAVIFWDVCQGSILEGVGDVVPVNIDYYGAGNSSIAFDLTVKIKYKESVDLKWKSLEYLSLPPGDVVSGGVTEQQ